ncbi:serine/arginine repetitive matrix protein 2 [Streptomyces sp. DASNCL29]|uniref:serine/arginine repetitive matrix protein 2 n=1 Tax=Streptomyces sp. DASNCL29 TaxID=2583819 RepID=UPI001F0EAAB8|nr:serine/arginine repetitive matrix protein 2 [Streptomyces sp. DASNCL29]
MSMHNGGAPGQDARRVLRALAVTIFLVAGIAFSGWVAFGGDGTSRNQAGPLPWDRESPTATPSGEASQPSDLYPSPGPETSGPTDLPTDLPTAPPTGAPSGSPSATPFGTPSSPSLTGAAPPAGYSTQADPAGYHLAVPDGWRRTAEGPSVYYTSPDDSTVIQIFELHGPESTPYESAQEAERIASTHRDYEQIALTRLGSAAMDPVQLEYTYQSKSDGHRRMLDRRFAAPNGTMYAVLVNGPSGAGDRVEERKVHQAAVDTFCPTAYCTAS